MNEVRVSTLESESSKPQMSLILAIQSSYSQGLPGSSRGFQEDGFVEGEAENKTARTRAIGIQKEQSRWILFPFSLLLSD